MRNKKPVPISKMIVLLIVLMNAILLRQAYTESGKWYFALIVTLPLLMIAAADIRRRKRAVGTNFTMTSHLRHFFDSVRQEMRQIFSKSNLDGKSFNDHQRSMIDR